mgnify:CR=1 FL=1
MRQETRLSSSSCCWWVELIILVRALQFRKATIGYILSIGNLGNRDAQDCQGMRDNRADRPDVPSKSGVLLWVRRTRTNNLLHFFGPVGDVGLVRKSPDRCRRLMQPHLNYCYASLPTQHMLCFSPHEFLHPDNTAERRQKVHTGFTDCLS